MIQKILVIIFIFIIFIFSINFLKKIKSFGKSGKKSTINEENIVDLEKDPKTNEYRPKDNKL